MEESREVVHEPIINIDADETLFKYHLFNNPQMAFLADALMDRIEKAELDQDHVTANKLRQRFRELFFKAPDGLEQALARAQLELNAHIAIASYSEGELPKRNYTEAERDNEAQKR